MKKVMFLCAFVLVGFTSANIFASKKKSKKRKSENSRTVGAEAQEKRARLEGQEGEANVIDLTNRSEEGAEEGGEEEKAPEITHAASGKLKVAERLPEAAAEEGGEKEKAPALRRSSGSSAFSSSAFSSSAFSSSAFFVIGSTSRRRSSGSKASSSPASSSQAPGSIVRRTEPGVVVGVPGAAEELPVAVKELPVGAKESEVVAEERIAPRKASVEEGRGPRRRAFLSIILHNAGDVTRYLLNTSVGKVACFAIVISTLCVALGMSIRSVDAVLEVVMPFLRPIITGADVCSGLCWTFEGGAWSQCIHRAQNNQADFCRYTAVELAKLLAIPVIVMVALLCKKYIS